MAEAILMDQKGGTDGILIKFDNYVSDNPIIYNTKQLMRLELPIGSKYKFIEHSEEQVAIKTSISVNLPATGYIKIKSGDIS